MSNEPKIPAFDPAVSHQALGFAQDVRGKVYQLCPENDPSRPEGADPHEHRLALASTYTLNALLLAASEIAIEYGVPLALLKGGLMANYEEMEAQYEDDGEGALH